MNRIFSILFVALSLVSITPSAVAGIIYDVNRSWTNGSVSASLVGTVDVDLGNYSIQNAGADPFNSVNLTLTVGATSYNVVNVITDLILGSGVFNIQATTTELIFSALGDGTNPADLIFSDSGIGGNRYAIGSDGNPAFEIGITGAGNVLSNTSPRYPLVWGTASQVPEPLTLALMGVGLAGISLSSKRKSRA